MRISKPQARHGARLPFDFLLNSLAREYGARTVCVVLSGTGADGSLGLKAVKDKGGLVIPSPCFFASRSTPRSARSNCRYSRATSIPTRWRGLATASIPTRSRPTFRQSDWPGFSPRRIAITGSRPNCARTSCSRCTTCSPTRHSRVSIFVSCRNLLIYLLPEAQAKVISIIHFALRDGGLLLVGDAETVGVADGRFAVISKPQRIYRRVRGARPGDFGLSSSAGDGSRLRARPGPAPIPSRQIDLAELCRRMVLEAYGPAAVLINRKLECLHFQGPIDRYLKVASGRPAHELIAMAREGVRAKLRSAVQRALRENGRVVVRGADERRGRRLVIQHRRHAGAA